MNARELFGNILHYGEFDRMPVIHWALWQETRERWEREGMPPGVNQHRYFDAVPQWAGISPHLSIYPPFEVEVVEETDEYVVQRDESGVLQKTWKNQGSVPHYLDWKFKTAKDWPAYKERLQPDPGRLPDDFDDRVREAEESGLPVSVRTASLMGWVRNWMGVENMCFMMYDDPNCFADTVETLSDLACWGIDQVASRMKGRIDIGHGWEDIAGSTGPFVSPDLFEKYVAPGYRKIRAKLEEHGVDIYSVDSDGNVEALIGPWLAAGVNCMFPLEPGTWKMTPEKARAKYGRDLLIIGGFDKLALERGRDAIDAEFESHISLMKEGGFVMMPDHLITPGVPLDDYKYYLDKVRELRF